MIPKLSVICEQHKLSLSVVAMTNYQLEDFITFNHGVLPNSK